MNDWEATDIQGLVFSSYGDSMRAATYHVLQIDNVPKAQAWLAELANRITPGLKPTSTPAFCLNIALTRSGLEKLGISAEKIDTTFEPAFQEGMTSDRRKRILGDLGSSAPEKWDWGNTAKPVDVLLMLFAPDDAALKILEQKEFDAYTTSGLTQVVPPIDATPINAEERYSREHFGFADGISQPKPVIADSAKNLETLLITDPDVVPGGEFVFGYKNAYWNFPLVPGRDLNSTDPNPNAFGRNGTFLVVCQMEQDVSAFWNFLLKVTNNNEQRATWLAAKMVGRWPSGAIVTEGVMSDPGLPKVDENKFDFANDVGGTGVPIGSHIRRSNPRGTVLAEDRTTSLDVSRRHRIIRRARSYGPIIENKFKPDGKNVVSCSFH